MSDRELLELAAKAAGMWNDTDPWNGMLKSNGMYWNPLTDDGDALRLAVRLEIAVRFYDGEANAFGKDIVDHFKSGSDPCAAIRLAIVRVAAEIGRNMK